MGFTSVDAVQPAPQATQQPSGATESRGETRAEFMSETGKQSLRNDANVGPRLRDSRANSSS